MDFPYKPFPGNLRQTFVVTGKDTDDRFSYSGSQLYTKYVSVGRSGYVEGSAIQLRGAFVFNILEKKLNDCSKFSSLILDMKQSGFFVEGQTDVQTIFQ